MARRHQQTNFEAAIELAARLPWWISLFLAMLAYCGLHFWATRIEPPPTDLAQLGAFAGRQLYRAVALFLQYLVPVILVIGSAVSYFTNRPKG